jgi:hypothetical protein
MGWRIEMWPKASTRPFWWRMWFARMRRRRAWRKRDGIGEGILGGGVDTVLESEED